MENFQYEIKEINDHNYIVRFFDKNNNKIINCYEFLDKLKKDDSDFYISLNNSILNIPFKGFFFESVPLKQNNLMEDYFYIASETNFSKKDANPHDFKTYFHNNDRIVDFLSQSSNILVCPNSNLNVNYKKYLHLKKFVKNGSSQLTKSFWQRISIITFNELKKNETIWLKTHGHLIDYFHFRIQHNSSLYVNSALKTIDKAYKLYNKCFKKI